MFIKVLMWLVMLVSLISVSNHVTAKDVLKPTMAKRVDIGGLDLYIECYGKGAPAIIINTGFGGAGSAGDWEVVVKELSKSNQICLYDRANLGKSDGFTKDYDVGVMAEHLSRLLKASQVTPPYLLVSHSYGSYPVKIFNHHHSDDVSGILLVDPSQYGMFYNGIAKWAPEEDNYDAAFLARMKAELSGWNDPNQNPEKVNLKTSAKLIKQSSDFGSTPFVLLWNKNGVWKGGEAPDTWHPNAWNRMKKMYAAAIDDMHSLSTNKRIVFANTTEHNIYQYEPESVIREVKYLLSMKK